MKRRKIFKKPNLRKLNCSDHGVVGIVVAVLLIGLLVSVVSLIQYQYVPKWMEEKEAEHMDDVLTQFSQLKFAIDTQSASNQTNTPIATSITLGSKELPYLMSMRSYGRLEIIRDECIITIVDSEGAITGPITIGIIKYTSANAYFIPEEKQSYVYEAGAIITNQTKGSSISIKPSFKPILKPNFKIFFNVVNILGIADKVSVGGYDTIAIQTEYNGSKKEFNETDGFVEYIYITSSYQNAWHVFLNSSLISQELQYGDDFTITETGDGVSIKFFDSGSNPDGYGYPYVELTITDILSQIGPGWVE